MSKPQSNRDKAKIALIPVLICVLVAVLFQPGPASKVTNDPAPDQMAAAPAASSQIAETDLQRVLTTLKKRQQVSMDYEEVVSYDPFQNLPLLRRLASAPDILTIAADTADSSDAVEAIKPPPAEPEEAPPTFEEIKSILQTRQVSVVLQGISKNSAIIDERIVHVGDLLEPGLRIVDIKSTGIVVRIEPEQ